MNEEKNEVISTVKTNEKNGFNSIWIIGIFGVITLVGIILVGMFFIGNITDDKEISLIFDPKKPIAINKDNKYGYITSEGKPLIDTKYESVNDFWGEFAVVEITNKDENSRKKSLYNIVDRAGNIRIEGQTGIEPRFYSKYNVWLIDSTLYNDKLKKISPNGATVSYIGDGLFEFIRLDKKETGIINHLGKEIFTLPEIGFVSDISKNNDNEEDLYVLLVKGEEKSIIVSSKTGKIVYTLEKPKDTYLSVEDDNIFRIIKKDGTFATEKFLYFRDGELAYEIGGIYNLQLEDYNRKILEFDFGLNYKDIGRKTRRAYYDLENKKLSDDKPSVDIESIELPYGYQEISSYQKQGLIKDMDVIIPCKYDDITFLTINLYEYIKEKKGQELALFENDDKTILMNVKNQKEIATFNSTDVSSYSSSTFLEVEVYEEDNHTIKEILIYNLLSDKSMSFSKDADISIYSNYITVKENKKKTYYNTELEAIYVEET